MKIDRNASFLKPVPDTAPAGAGFSLLTMQKSYQSASLAEELEKFLKITGMSRVLFNNLAAAYK